MLWAPADAAPAIGYGLAVTLSLNPRTTALILIDIQKGTLAMPLSPHGAGTVIANAARLGRAFNEAGATVALVHVAFSADGRDRLSQPVDAPMPIGNMPADWSDLAPEIASLSADVAIAKRHWGAFHGTELDLQLRRRAIDTVVIGGIATNFGVEQTAREARQLNYAVVIAEDASSSIGDDLHRFSIEKIMPRLARVRSTDEIVAALRAQ
ncbi:MAG TPA: hydrolase [Roseiarcus sp.]|nr:hydrolase [Roseiarcus sp.]